MYTFKASDFKNVTSLSGVPIILNFVRLEIKHAKPASKKNSIASACKQNSHCYDSIDKTGFDIFAIACSKGYAGNPYLNQGCQDVNECENSSNNPCEGYCTNGPGTYQCSFPDGSYGDVKKDGPGWRCTKKVKTLPLLESTLGLGFGLLFLLAGGTCLFLILKKRQLMKLMQRKTFSAK